MGFEWYEAALMMIGSVLVLMGLSIPVAFAFLLINIAGAYIFMGGWRGVVQLVANSGDAVASFVLVTVPLFILMGTLFFHSGLALKIIGAVDRSLSKAPGRLSYIAIITSTIFAALSGSNIANTAMMGHLLLPEMEKRNYKPMMSIGPIMGSGGLALLIPPSTLGVLLGSIAQLNIAALLLAGMLPGLVLGALYMAVVKIQSMAWPEAAPAYDVEPAPLLEKLRLFAVYVLPMSLVVFCVVGFILLGIATPTESAAFGVLSVLALAACYRCLSVKMLKKSLISTLHVSVMVFFIILTSKNFSQILAFSGATRGLIDAVTMLDFGTYGTLALLFGVLLVLGMFVDGIAMMLLTIPVFFPIITQLGFDPIWFALIMLLAIEMSGTTPPMGLILFVMQGVAPKGTRFWTIVKAGFPYLAADAVLLLLLILMPGLALWLPSLMR
ncbi:TRAP transporter large permease [Psychromarinibacter halotolerans]|uniref:TRAP transporter large permease protein n=1 Tax=Psychromarinibacter halotolerans TaxID=1775175 RepID=A0ABV7GZ53_9RHOB|nr:TRAP transporter large permease [Psychromarinibacter halotolerans]MDF0596299.1 TRAP transporter large permease [Psychromarinibacter halotolerans]